MKILTLSTVFALSCAAPVLAHDGVDHGADHAAAAAHAATDAAEVQLGSLRVSGAFARATLPSAPVGGAYFTVTNVGEATDRLLGLATDVAERVEIHEMIESDGVMRMRPLQGPLELAPGASVSLAPGGLHLMLMGLKRQLVEGETITLTLEFEGAGSHAVPFSVQKMNASGAGHGGKADAPCHTDADGAEHAHGAEASGAAKAEHDHKHDARDGHAGHGG